MIYSDIGNISNYITQDYLQVISDFIRGVSPDMEEKIYPLVENKVYARVMSYDTNEPMKCKIEAHNKYIDIQASILGAEKISLFERKKLTEIETYSEEKDIVFYKYSQDAYRGSTINVPGFFTMLFPEDAHRPQENVIGYDKVKKFVIKVHV